MHPMGRQDEDNQKPAPSILKASPPTGNDVLSIHKNRSTGNLLSDVGRVPEGTRIRFSLDAGKAPEHDPMSRSPVMGERDHGLGVSGLRWIRQQPVSRPPTLPPSPDSSFSSPARSASMTIDMSHSRTFTPGGPASPSLNFSEDLSRFPSESLHSFSFAQQSEEVLHNRQTVLRRTIDFVDTIGLSANHPGLLSAQAKVSGDIEVQSMMELLARANVLSGAGTVKSLDRHGPLTGPAESDGANIFEKSFISQGESFEQARKRSYNSMAGGHTSSDRRPTINTKVTLDDVLADVCTSPTSLEPAGSRLADISVTRPGLKRTYTDTSPLSLQTKLIEALSKPYLAKDGGIDNQLLSPTAMHSFGKAANGFGGTIAPLSKNSHRWAPAAQAIFTTEAHAPYTILAANDLACLVFGVTKAEVRRIGILEVVREDRRAWLEEKLRMPGSEAAAKARSPTGKARQNSPNGSKPSSMRGGITALLLSKPPARTSAARRAQTDDGSGSSYAGKNPKKSAHHLHSKSRGVLLCGDVMPIVKRNGATGSATLWVKEKRSALIWVLEEIVEDMAFLTLDEAGKILAASGAHETIWGRSQKLERMDIRRILPSFPMTSGQVDYDLVTRLEHFTARHEDDYNIPVSVTATSALGELRVSSFPHIAGMMVLSAETLEIISSNSVFAAALFGQSSPDGLLITQLIPHFDSILNLIKNEESVKLVDGIVIPEHSFRKARALLALREGNAEAAAIFLRPTGLTAKHRDGSNIHVDVSMRVVKSETMVSEESVIEEQSDSGSEPGLVATSKVVYALWITYSRHLHSMAFPSGPGSPLISRPGTPPRQPSPGQSVNIITPYTDSDDTQQPSMSPESLISKKIEEATLEPISSKPYAQPPVNITISTPLTREPPTKKTINDYVVLEEMGQGAYGQVKLARYKKPPSTKVVLKYVTKKRILMDCWYRDRRLGTVPLEVHVLDYLRKDGLRHPNIVEMTDFFEDNTNYYIEMVPHGLPGMDLFDYIEMRSTMEEEECKNIFLQVVAALHHLHTKALVVHRDIKDENIVLDGERKVKLIDFGSAAYIKNGPFDVFVGTIDYAAPEVLQGKPYRGKEQDVWALGILLYTLVYKENPFYSVDEILDHELRIPWIMSEGSIDLIKAMLTRDVEKRLTISQIREHPWCLDNDASGDST